MRFLLAGLGLSFVVAVLTGQWLRRLRHDQRRLDPDTRLERLRALLDEVR